MDSVKSPPGAPVKLPDSVVLNQMIMEYGVLKAGQREAEVAQFINGSSKINMVMMEIFKGLLADRIA